MSALPPIHPGEEFREFWNATHPHELASYGFDPSSPLHFAFERRGETGNIVAALILVPLIQAGALLGHHVHLCSVLRSKGLFQFCNAVMIAAMDLPQVGLVCAETQDKPEYRRAGRVAKGLGFTPVFVKELGWTDYVWNSKAA
jgi:hypothetical protein